MKVDTSTLLLFGALGLGAYFVFSQSQKHSQQANLEAELKFQQLASALNATQSQQVQMAALFEKALAKAGGNTSKALQDQQLIAGYVNMGLGAATTIASIIGSLV